VGLVPHPEDRHTKAIRRLVAVHGSVIDIVFPSAALLMTEITPLGEGLTQ
jgi:hypothetical protein